MTHRSHSPNKNFRHIKAEEQRWISEFTVPDYFTAWLNSSSHQDGHCPFFRAQFCEPQHSRP
jgi:hypothetical protein